MFNTKKKSKEEFKFFEFFAGGGMARAGLGNQWQCLFANDIDKVKASTYINNWGDGHFDGRDIREVKSTDLEGSADLAWASFPCQDLSVAGNGLGIGSSSADRVTRSGALWPFLDLISELRQESRQPPLLVLENVVGLLTLERGRDFSAICSSLGEMGYRYGAVIIDAKNFLPQSRPRVFIVAVNREVDVPSNLFSDVPQNSWHTPTLLRAYQSLPESTHSNWVWWDLGLAPVLKENALEQIIKIEDVEWNTSEETKRFIDMMVPIHVARLEEAMSSERFRVGSLYLRMRRDGALNKQRAEITFSPTLGCLRTPRGGGSRPRIIVAGGGQVRTRLLSIHEAAALMGLENTYKLPETYQHAFKVIGDGVAVPPVRFLADRLLEPLALAARKGIALRAERMAAMLSECT